VKNENDYIIGIISNINNDNYNHGAKKKRGFKTTGKVHGTEEEFPVHDVCNIIIIYRRYK